MKTTETIDSEMKILNSFPTYKILNTQNSRDSLISEVKSSSLTNDSEALMNYEYCLKSVLNKKVEDKGIKIRQMISPHIQMKNFNYLKKKITIRKNVNLLRKV